MKTAMCEHVYLCVCVCVFYLSEQDAFQISVPVNIIGTNLIFTTIFGQNTCNVC